MSEEYEAVQVVHPYGSRTLHQPAAYVDEPDNPYRGRGPLDATTVCGLEYRLGDYAANGKIPKRWARWGRCSRCLSGFTLVFR